MPITFKEQQKKLINAQHELAVWEFLFKVLDDDYVSKDGRQAAKAIRVTNCVSELVSEDTIEEVLSSIASDFIETLRKDIETMENEELVVLSKEDVKHA